MIFPTNTIEQRKQILGRDARFDSSGCISHEGSSPFIYPSRGEGGQRNLFKVLLTNLCENNCLYCINRKNRNNAHYTFSPKELALTFMNYYKSGIVKGLFLSSGIYKSPDITQERIIEAIKLLRERYGYTDYIHTKILPGASPELIEEAAPYSDRISVNLEAPGDNYLKRLSREKRYLMLLSTLRAITKTRKKEKQSGFSITTQFVVGAAGESDLCLLRLTKKLYGEFGLTRVYYSGFSPQPDTPMDSKPHCPPSRIRRLYQADFLIRRYNFEPQDIVPTGTLPDTDPKLNWAQTHPELFPVEINKSPFEELISVPGIGIVTAKRILKARQYGRFTLPGELRKIGIRGKTFLEFITINGRYYGRKTSSLDSPKWISVD